MMNISVSLCGVAGESEPQDDSEVALTPSSDQLDAIHSPKPQLSLIIKGFQPLRYATVDLISEDRKSINSKPAGDAKEVLQNQAGVNMVTYGGLIRSSSPTIRGSLSRHVRVMLDDIPLSFPEEGTSNVNIIPVAAVDSLQIWKDGCSSVYGSGLGGAIKFKTIDPPATNGSKTRISQSLGSDSSSSTSGMTSFRKDRFGFVGSASYQDSEGYRPRSGFYARQGFTKLTYDFSESNRIVLSGGVSEANLEEFEYPPYDYWSHPSTIGRFGQISLQLGRFGSWENSLSLYGFDHFLRRDTNSLSTGNRLSRTELGSTVVGLNEELSRKSSFQLSENWRCSNKLTVGYNLERSTIDYKSIPDPVQYSTQGMFLRDIVAFDSVSFTLGCRYDETEAYGDYFSSEAGVMFTPRNRIFRDHIILRANVNRSFSAPPVLWRFYSSPSFIPNRDIEAEEALTYSSGVDFDYGDRFWASISAFSSSIDNALDTKIVSGYVRTMKNYREHRRRGVEIQTRHRLGNFELNASAFWGNTEDMATHEEVLGRVKRSYKLGLAYHHKSGVSCSVLGRYEDWNQPEIIQPDERHMIWDMRINKTFEIEKVACELFLTGRNIFDTAYGFDEFTQMPGRTIEAGLSLEF